MIARFCTIPKLMMRPLLVLGSVDLRRVPAKRASANLLAPQWEQRMTLQRREPRKRKSSTSSRRVPASDPTSEAAREECGQTKN